MYDAVEVRHGERLVVLVLAHAILGARNLLERGRDDEVTVVHGNHVRRELRAKVVVRIQLLPRMSTPGSPQGLRSCWSTCPQACNIPGKCVPVHQHQFSGGTGLSRNGALATFQRSALHQPASGRPLCWCTCKTYFTMGSSFRQQAICARTSLLWHLNTPSAVLTKCRTRGVQRRQLPNAVGNDSTHQ